MANKVLTLVIDTLEDNLDHVFAAAIDELHKAGHKVQQVRLTTDAGETVRPVNTIAGVTVPEPVSQEPAPEEPVPEVEPAPTEPAPAPEPAPETPEVPVDTPVDPTTAAAPPAS